MSDNQVHPRVATEITTSADWWVVGTDPRTALLVRGGSEPVAVKVSAASGDDLLALVDAANGTPSSNAALPDLQPQTALPSAAPARRPKRTKKTKKPAQERQTAAGAPPPAPPIDGNAISVSLQPREEAISFNGQSMELTSLQAKLAAVLAAASPHPVDRRALVSRVWNRELNETTNVLLGQLAGKVAAAAVSIGLRLNVIRGVGIALQPMEPSDG